MLWLLLLLLLCLLHPLFPIITLTQSSVSTHTHIPMLNYVSYICTIYTEIYWKQYMTFWSFEVSKFKSRSVEGKHHWSILLCFAQIIVVFQIHSSLLYRQYSVSLLSWRWGYIGLRSGRAVSQVSKWVGYKKVSESHNNKEYTEYNFMKWFSRLSEASGCGGLQWALGCTQGQGRAYWTREPAKLWWSFNMTAKKTKQRQKVAGRHQHYRQSCQGR